MFLRSDLSLAKFSYLLYFFKFIKFWVINACASIFLLDVLNIYFIGFRVWYPTDLSTNLQWREARKAGQLYFQTLTRSEPDLNVARNLFSEMDLNGDGFVHWSEIVHFLARKGGMTLEEARRICLNMGMVENTYISFEDVVASWYIFVMRPWCDRCGAMIMGSYYSCVACFNSNTYDLCPDCYRSGNFSHQHQIFLDNYVLLHQKTWRQVIRPLLSRVSVFIIVKRCDLGSANSDPTSSWKLNSRWVRSHYQGGLGPLVPEFDQGYPHQIYFVLHYKYNMRTVERGLKLSLVRNSY